MKKTTKLLCGLLGVGFLLTGCATVSTIKNRDSELIFNGNSAVMINESYLYYGNSFADYSAFENDTDYKTSAKLSYLARLEAGAKLSAKTEDYSPKGVETVAKEVAVHEKSFMFALGDWIYYLTPNRKKFENEDGKLVQQFGYSTLYRSKLNGDKKKALYTTSAEISKIEVLKYGKKYYLVMLAGTNLIRFELGKSVKRETIAKNVTSVALPETYQKNRVGSTLDWNGNIYYTTALKDDDNPSISGTKVMKLSISSGKEIEVGGGQGQTISLVDRVGDDVFYTSGGETFKIDTNEGFRFSTDKSFLYDSSEISNVYSLYSDDVLAYIYTAKSATICHEVGQKDGYVLTLKYQNENISDYKILFVTGRTIYLSTKNAIYTADASQALGGSGEIACTALVKMADDSIYDGNRYAFDGNYVYYYAKLQEIKKDEDSSDEKEEETKTDDNYYLYRTKVGLNADIIGEGYSTKPYELLSKTYYSDRHTK